MNKIVNKFLLPGFEFMPELHRRQPGFTYSACGPFNKHRERIQKLNPNQAGLFEGSFSRQGSI